MAPKRRKPNPKTGNEDEGTGPNATIETPIQLTKAAQKRKAKSNNSEGDLGIDSTTEDVQNLASPTKSTSVTPAERKPPPRKRKANPKYDDNNDGGDDIDQEEDEQTAQRKKPKRGNQSKRIAAPRKSKTHTKKDDEHDGNDQIAEDEKIAAKLAAGTPTRTSAPRLRKANPKYADDDDGDIDDDEFVERVQQKAETPKKRTPASRKAKVQRDDPEWLVTNEKSPLAYEDLHVSWSPIISLYGKLFGISLGSVLTHQLNVLTFTGRAVKPKDIRGFHQRGLGGSTLNASGRCAIESRWLLHFRPLPQI